MSDINTQRDIRRANEGVNRLRATIEIPELYLPWTQRILNPVPLASSPAAWGDSGQPFSTSLVVFYASVFVNTTNNGSNFWTLTVIDSAGTTLASASTATASANTWTRITDTTFTQPSTSNAIFILVATATGAPGSIYIAPALGVSRA